MNTHFLRTISPETILLECLRGLGSEEDVLISLVVSINPVAEITVVGSRDTFTVSNFSAVNSILLIICKESPESTINHPVETDAARHAIFCEKSVASFSR